MNQILNSQNKSCLLIIGMLILTGCGIDVQKIIDKAIKPQAVESSIPVVGSTNIKTESVAEVIVKFKLATGEAGFFAIDAIEWIKIDDYEYSKNKLLQNDLKIIIPFNKNQDSVVTIKLKGFDRAFYIPIVSENVTNDPLQILAYVNFGQNDREIDFIEVGYAQKDNVDKIDMNKNVFKSIDGQNFKEYFTIYQDDKKILYEKEWAPKTLIKDQPVPEQQSPPPGVSMPALPPDSKTAPKPPAQPEPPNRPYPLPPNPPPFH